MEENKKCISKVPNPDEFYLNTPLYQIILFSDSEIDISQLLAIKYFQEPLDSYCPYCDRHSIFHNSSNQISYNSEDVCYNHVYSIKFACSRNENHKLFYVVQILDNTIQKIGQYPSLADLQLKELVKYKKILSDEKYKEFIRAIGLSAHGVGIGSFVYLRRIFESLIEEARNRALKVNILDEEKYKKSRMMEKIKMLKDQLPELLVKNARIYNVLSKGIHELKENDCLKYFPVVKSGIELILDERLDQQKKLLKAETISKAIKEAGFEIGNTK